MVNLREKPYYLDEKAIEWVESTIKEMSIEEKIGQLFVNLGSSKDEDYLKNIVEKYHVGAARYNPGSSEQISEQNRVLQKYSKIPMLIAANAEAGGDGVCSNGTYIGNGIKCAAIGEEAAYEMGRISGIEAASVGCNWTFAPVVDILYNWRNPIISHRAFSDDPDKVLTCGIAYMKGVNESNVACCAKHFPGDGVDERDHHLSNSVNDMSCEDWDNSFGKVYGGLIDAGIPSVMVGHIMLPAYQKKINPKTSDADILPASLSKEILTGLLREQMGFNGLVVTDASHMVGLTASMARRDYVPMTIAAGCDLFLFFNDADEDFQWMMEGYKSGVISEERLLDALRRILGLKASLGLHKAELCDLVPPQEEMRKVLGCEEHIESAKAVSDKAITLVKSNEEGLLPISPEKTKRVLLVPQRGAPGMYDFMTKGKNPAEIMTDMLIEEGFDVTVYESIRDKLEKMDPEEKEKAVLNVYAGKASIASFVAKYDLIIHVCDVNGMMLPFERIMWGTTKGTPDIPWYVHEVPTIFISVCCPFHLADVPQIKTFINCYDKKDHTLKACVDKLVGRSEFKGVSPVDAFCGYADARR